MGQESLSFEFGFLDTLYPIRDPRYPIPMPGPPVRTDIIDVYVFRKQPRVEFLQMRRAQGALVGYWHPVMGHALEGETSPQTALRELAEETGYKPSDLWQLEQPNIYYLASHETIVLSPCFAALVDPDTEPTLNEEHSEARWVDLKEVETSFLWPGQRQAIAQIVRDLLPEDSPHLSLLRIDLE